jgi:Icc-related predicted phosphoesterase
MKITCIADLHGYYPELDGGDLLIVAGDLTARDTEEELHEFDYWLCHQPYKKKIFIAGNHDNLLIEETPRKYMMRVGEKKWQQYEYLCDSGTEFEGLKIWGSPWTMKFKGMNPHCMAFTCDTEDELTKKWELIPEDIDILITHTPPFGLLDKTCRNEYVGSEALGFKTWDLSNLKFHIFGHVHEAYGQSHQAYATKGPYDKDPIPIGHISVNCSYVNEHYQPVNKPINIQV